MSLQECICERCGATWKSSNPEPQTLCSECTLHNLVAALSKQKLEAVREHLREGSMVRAIWELRLYPYMPLSQSVDLAHFIRRQDKSLDWPVNEGNDR